jgi:hypothetical protein
LHFTLLRSILASQSTDQLKPSVPAQESEEVFLGSSPELGSTALEEVTNRRSMVCSGRLKFAIFTIDKFPGSILIGIIAWTELSQQAIRVASAAGQRHPPLLVEPGRFERLASD